MLNFDKVDNEYKKSISADFKIILLRNRAQKKTANDNDILYFWRRDYRGILQKCFILRI